LDWLSEEGDWSRLNEAATGSRKDHRGALKNADCDSPFTQPPLKFAEVGVQVAYEQRRLAGRFFDGRIIRVKGQLDVV
jgi:hypothetical protein